MMINMGHSLVIALFLIVTAFISNTASAAEERWMVNGKVLEMGTRKPLQGATVSVKEYEQLETMADENGKFSIELNREGVFTILATTLGVLKPKTITVKLTKNSPVEEITFYLQTTTVLAEVVISADRNPNRVGKTIIKGKELRELPGSSGDPLKGLQSLPGVAMSNGSSSAPAVRGSGPGDNFYYADAIPVGKVFHISGISVFNADLIESFNLYSAAFAPYYDNVTGAILDITLRNPRTDRIGTKFNVSLTGADFLLEGPIAQDQSFYFAARRSYFDLLIRSVERKNVTLQIPNYSDYLGKYIWNANLNHRFSFHLTGAADSLRLQVGSDSDLAKTQPDLIGTIESQDSTVTQAVVWDAKLSDSVNNKLVSGHRVSMAESNIAQAGKVFVATNTNFVREKLDITINNKHELALAINISHSYVALDLDFKNTNCTQFNTGCDLSSAPRVQLKENFAVTFWDAALQDRWRILSDVTLIAGIRHNKDSYLNKSYTEPRLGAEWEWSEKTLLTAGWGKHNQVPSGQQIAPNFGNPQLGHILADHSVVGVSHKLDADWSWKAEAYYKKFSDLVVGVSDPAVNYVNGASGKAYGTELLIKKEATERLSGWLALTVSRSERQNDLTGETFRFEYDQPVNATLITKYKISEEWTFGSKWNYYTGRPYTPILGTNGNYSDGRPIPLYGGINSATLPDFHRLDIRFDRYYVFDTWKLNTYFEFNNVYGRKNLVGYDYGPNYDKKEGIEPYVIPVSFGAQGEF